jgi:NAD(P)-dependent dehydrogenase (short-subunit alcohol dehydrogenase family)
MPVPDVSDTPLAQLVSLRGRSAVVTGAARGLGRAVAARLAEAGARVLVTDVDGDAAARCARDLADGFQAEVVGAAMDVTDGASVRAVADDAVGRWGRLDAWVNNAGVFPAIPIAQITDEAWDRVFAVNTRGALNGTRESARVMSDRGGVIVNVVSTAGFRGSAPGLAAYVGSKHAVRGLTRQSALELAPQGIRVLGVAPGYVPTEGNQLAAAAALADGPVSDESTPLMRMAPAGRIGTPDDIARVVLFCVSDLSAYMTGSTLLVDGGDTA